MFLEAITSATRPLGTSELSVLLNVPQPTSHRIMHMLESEGFVEREPGSRRFAPGTRLIKLGIGTMAASARIAPRRAILESLSERIGETCNFGIRAGNSLTYLDRVEAAWPFGLRFEPGSRVPLHCTSMGKLFLSFMPKSQRHRFLRLAPLHRYTEHTVTDLVQFEAEAERIRDAKYATDNQEFLAGVVCVAVPVRAFDGSVAAALAVSAPAARMTLEKGIEYVPLLRDAADRMAESLEGSFQAEGRLEKKRRG